MGQKVNPNGLRLGINKDWEAKWYSNKKDFSNTLAKDIEIRNCILDRKIVRTLKTGENFGERSILVDSTIEV